MSRKERIKPPLNRPLQHPLSDISHQVIPTSPRLREASKSSGMDKLMKVFFILGAVFLVVYFGLRINQEIQLAYFAPKVPVEQAQTVAKVSASPQKIVISKVKVDLPIKQTVITNGVWEISPDGASYLGKSAKPGEKGTIILYGHNTNERFGPIRWLKKGDKIEIRTSDGKKHIYAISQTMKVKPEQMDVFDQKGETLILYTCDGFADLERFVVIAKPQN